MQPDFQALFESIPGCVLVLAPDRPRFTILAATDAYLQATRTQRDQIVGRGVFEVFPDNPDAPESAGTAARASFERVLETRQPDTMAIQRHDIRRPESEGGGFEERHWSPLNTPVLGDDGQVRYIIHRVEDVTELVRARQNGAEQQAVAEALRESERQYRVVAENTYDFEFWLDPQDHFIYASPACERIYGYGPAEFIADPALRSRAVHPEDRARWDEHLRTVEADHTPGEIEYRIVHRDGSVRWIGHVCQPVVDEQGRYLGVRGSNRDITERKQAEEALRESEDRYRTLFDSMTEGFALHEIMTDDQGRPVDYRFIDVNPAFERLTGLKRADLLGKRVLEVLPDTEADWIEHYGRVALTGEPVRFENHSAALGRWYEVFAYRPVPCQFAVVFTDITERRLAQAELERTRNTLAEAQKIAHLGSFEYVAATRTTVWSEEEYRIYGLDPSGPSPAYDVMLAECIHPDDAALLHETFTKAMQDRSIYEMEHRIVRPDGCVRWVYDRAHPYFDEQGNFLRYVGATLDITDRKRVEEALQESEERFRLALKNSPVLVAMQDADLVYRWAYNTRTRRAEDVIGKTDADLFAPEDMPSILEAKRKVLQTGEVVRHQHWLTSNHQRVFLDCYYEPVRDAAGKITGVGIAAVNLTAQKQAEEALRELNERLEERVAARTAELARAVDNVRAERQRFLDMLDTLPVVIDIIRSDHRIEWANRAYREALGDNVGRLCYQSQFGIDKPCEECQAFIPLETGKPHNWEWTLPNGRTFDIHNFPFTAADGSPAILEMDIDITARRQAEEILKNLNETLERQVAERTAALRQSAADLEAANARLRGSQSAALNLMEDADIARRRAEEAAAALRQSREDLDRAQAVGQIGSWRLDVRRNVLTWSDENHRIFGVPQGTPMTYETFLGIIHPDDREYVDTQWKASLRGEPYDIEHRLLVDGQVKWVREKAYLEFDDAGNLLGGFGITQDISERKAAEEVLRRTAEELKRSNEDLEQFAYVASHDLQEPLRMVGGFLRLLEDRYKPQLDDRACEYIGFAVQGAQRMSRLIQDLLSYSRVQRMGRPLQPTDANVVLAEALAGLAGSIEEAGATVTRDELPTVNADPTQLTQLFQNLIGNAIKFRRPDEPCRIHVGVQAQAGQWVFAVRDNGIGIEPKYSERIFVIFQRLHGQEEYPGTGIGLAVCKKIVERHGGRIWVESTPGEGASFCFTLPA